jgi:uncharacterized protein YecE (DUF72 family)
VSARVGCSGWNYASWRDAFYARDLPASRWLEHYATVFDTVEVNNTFYRLPERSVFANWCARVPRTFLFAVKASRFLTHMKRLREPTEPLTRLFSRADALERHLGPVLYQLPGSFQIDLDRLDRFLNALPRAWSSRRLQHVMEFRHPSWYVDETFQLLQRRRVALCLHDKDGSTITAPFVGPIVYVRFHGTSGRYSGSYPDRQLDAWAKRLTDQIRDGRRVYAYFNNDPNATAVRNALTLRRKLEQL